MTTILWIFAAASWIIFIGFTRNATSYLNCHHGFSAHTGRNTTAHSGPNRRLGTMPNTFTRETLLSAVFLAIALVSSLAAINF